MILFANGGMSYMLQGPGLQSNLSAVYAHPLACGKQAVPPIVPTAAALGTPMVGYEPYGVTIKPPPPLPETRHNPNDPPFNQQPAGGVLEVTGSSQAAATSQPSPASAFSSTAHASEWGAPRQNVHHHPENSRSAIPTAQQKKQYHQYQKQLHERGLVEIKAAATAAAAEATAIATTKATATSPPEEEQNVDRMMAQDMSTAKKELAQMRVYLQNVARQQRMMVDDTLNRWTRSG
ncbi:hypothetical protein PG994_003304 [Apiospora phragmitis]|uniref:Uncharacterized protein n=1 Tax=Apiospora phragmitis TaxID=2905665 RepID=A0ABR1VXW3_9PEZI